jgi:hypothetical protein
MGWNTVVICFKQTGRMAHVFTDVRSVLANTSEDINSARVRFTVAVKLNR